MDDDAPPPSKAPLLAVVGWLLFGLCFTTAMAVAPIGVVPLTWLCLAATAGTCVVPVLAGLLATKDLIGGRPGAPRAFVMGCLHLALAGFVAATFALVFASSG